MNSNIAFAKYNPVVILVFFTGAVVMSVMLMHPLFLLASATMSCICCMTVKKWKGVRQVLIMIPVFVAISIMNPIFNTKGTNVLFTYLGDRPFTFEALIFGMVSATMVVSVLLWFISYNSIIDSDGILYALGKASPAVTMIVTMTMRYVTNFKRKIGQIIDNRRSIGMYGSEDNKSSIVKNGITVISVLFSWAMESSIITGDSMKNRGHGLKDRTIFSIYVFRARDVMLLIFMIILMFTVVLCAIMGGTEAKYIPVFLATGMESRYLIIGICAYIAFLGTPALINIWEEVKWRSLRSRI